MFLTCGTFKLVCIMEHSTFKTGVYYVNFYLKLVFKLLETFKTGVYYVLNIFLVCIVFKLFGTFEIGVYYILKHLKHLCVDYIINF